MENVNVLNHTATSRKLGTVYVLISAVFFSLGGVLIKIIPWTSVSINGIRSIFALIVIAIYMKIIHHRFVINRTVVFGAVCMATMSLTFVMATKMTSAANAIVLQFTEPVFLIFLMWLIYKKKPGKESLVTCAIVVAGILCFFFDKLTPDGMAGNLIAIFSGFAYAFVFMIKTMKNSDFESSLIISNIIAIVIGIPFYTQVTAFSPAIWMSVAALGIFQFGFSYIFLSKGLDVVSPVTASLTSTIEPILNPILVAIVCGEMIGWVSMIGAVLVVGAVTGYSLWQARGNSAENAGRDDEGKTAAEDKNDIEDSGAVHI